MKKFKLSWSLGISLFFCLAQIPNLLTATELDLPRQLSQMSLEQKIGQLFIVGFPQTYLDQRLRQHIQKNKFGSFLLFKRNILNPKQVTELNLSLHQISRQESGILPIIAVDQEGGFVNRIPLLPSVPHAVSFGISNSTAISYAFGEEIGKVLQSLGFNMNLAPVLDLAFPKKKSFIGVRSFGADPMTVASLGKAYSAGLLKSYVIPTAKHFPGLGDQDQDPHLVSITRQESFKNIINKDLFPFKKYSELQGEKAIMLSHMIYPQLDENKVPASFSEKIIRHWLRHEVGFDGVVITDDLHMKASTDSNTVPEGAFKALSAGADIIMLSWSFSEQEKTVNYITKSYKEGKLPIHELDEKVLRILKMKRFVEQKKFVPQNYKGNIIASSTLSNIDYHLFKTKFQSVKDAIALSPGQQVCLYSSQKNFVNQMRTYLKAPLKTFELHPHFHSDVLVKSLRKGYCNLNIFTISNWHQAQLAVQLPEELRKSLVVINLSSAAFLRDTTTFQARLEVLLPYIQAGGRLAEFLNEKISTSLPVTRSQRGLARSPDVPAQSLRHPSSLKPISSRPQ